jgi:nitroimidazol reductase NimA-like FMN-containing flavoprotein (pyridoxamine 5'-phosphate oxidase superfamily)
LELLATQELGRLAVVFGDEPLIFPINYALHSGSVVFRTDPGTKLVAAGDRLVAFEVDGADAPHREGWSVIVRGTAREVRNAAQVRELDRLPLRPWAPGDKGRWVRLDERAITGRRVVHVEHR